MSLPTAEIWPPRFDVAVRQIGLTGPLAGSEAVVFSTTSVLVRFGMPAGRVLSAAAFTAAPRAAFVSLWWFG